MLHALFQETGKNLTQVGLLKTCWDLLPRTTYLVIKIVKEAMAWGK